MASKGEYEYFTYDGYLSLEPYLGSFEGLSVLELGDEMLNLRDSA